MDPDCESLRDFIAPVDDFCDKFEFEKLRYRYYKTAIMPCNWKVGQGFFNEFYHVQQSQDRKSHTSELQSLMRISYAVFCLKKKKIHIHQRYKLSQNQII